jgi:sugar O-acyltransferase (sialic acid O-acetyltransferase NeuD family)
MPKSKVLIIGAGGHATSCIEVIEAEDKKEIVGLIGTPAEIGRKLLGYEVLGSEKDFVALLELTSNLILGIGQIKSPNLRIEIKEKYIKNGFTFESVISPTAQISKHAVIGAGTVIMHRVVINAGVKIGDYSIINTGSIIEHDSKIGNFSHISTGVISNGETSIGDYSFVGSGTIIMERIKIGNNCIVGMGQHVRHDLSDNSKYVGN